MTILSAILYATAFTVIVTKDGVTPFAQFDYSPTPPDARTQAQWQTDCQNAALGTSNNPALGNGGPDASVADDTMTVIG